LKIADLEAERIFDKFCGLDFGVEGLWKGFRELGVMENEEERKRESLEEKGMREIWRLGFLKSGK